MAPQGGGGMGGIFGGAYTGLKYEKLGQGLQVLRFMLDPGQTLVGEAGCLLAMDDGISFESRMGDGSLYQMQDVGFMGMLKMAAKRVFTNESLFVTWFTNASQHPRMLTVAAPTMGTIVPVDLHKLPNSTIHAQGGAFLCSTLGVQFQIEMVKKFSTGMFAREGFILQKLIAEQGSPGQLFIHGGGTIIKKHLENEMLTLEPGCLMAFTDGIEFDIGFPGWKSAALTGNIFMSVLKGTGDVWVQSTPSSKMIDLIVARVPVQRDN